MYINEVVKLNLELIIISLFYRWSSSIGLSPDGVFSGLGSFLGALFAGILTGGVAIWIMRTQIKIQTKREERIQENRFNKILLLLNHYLNFTQVLIEDIKSIVDENEHSENKKYKINSTLNSIEDLCAKINAISVDDFPENKLIHYLNICQLLFILTDDIKKYLEGNVELSQYYVFLRHLEDFPSQIELHLAKLN
jgi:hypothetical protein